MREDLRELWLVMSHYQLITFKISHHRQEVFKVETNEGLKALKICNEDEGKILFISRIMDHLWKKGFRKIAPPLLTIFGCPYVSRKNKIYVLNDWITGNQCNFNALEDLKAAAATLAEFHKYSFGFELTSETRARIMSHKWITTFTERCNDLHLFVDLAIKNPTSFGEKYLLHYKSYIQRAENAKKMLMNSQYPALASKAIDIRGFVHRDVAGRNFIMHDQNKAWLIDFDYARYDLRVVDIVRIIERGLKNHKWDVATGKEIIQAYNLKNPICKEEFPVILAFLTFPQKAWRLFKRYFHGKRKWQEECFVRKFNNILKLSKEQNNFLKWFEKEYCR